MFVALFTRAWIEIPANDFVSTLLRVALFTRAWIEMVLQTPLQEQEVVALFTRAWIEISGKDLSIIAIEGRPLHEGVD